MSLSNLSVTDLITKAADLREMAETARTRDVRDALLRLAARYEELARARDMAGQAIQPGIDPWRLPPAIRRDSPDAMGD